MNGQPNKMRPPTPSRTSFSWACRAVWCLRPWGWQPGTNTNSVTLSRDGLRLYVTNGNTNAVAVVQLNGQFSEVVGLIPTGCPLFS